MTEYEIELSRVEKDISTCLEALRYPKLGAVQGKRLYARLWSLYRQRNTLERTIATYERVPTG